jgi:hypothetical protein
MNRLILAVVWVCVLGCGSDPEPPPGKACDVGLNLDFQGLWTNPNPTSKVPAGAARAAPNVVSSRPGAAECAVGQGPLPGSYATPSERLRSGIVYGGYNFEATETALYRRDLGSALMDVVGAVAPADATQARLHMTVAGNDLYLATSQGLRSMDHPLGTIKTPGVPRMPDLFEDPSSTSTTGSVWLAPGATVAYRSVLAEQDSDGVIVQGEPSGRIVYKNSGASPVRLNVGVRLPTDAQPGQLLQVFRTTQVASGADPGDLMFQFYEAPITADDITAGAVVVSDITPDVALGMPLYTNATQSGITQANARPPAARDLALFRQNLFLAGTQQPHRLLLRIIAAPTSDTLVRVNGYGYGNTLPPGLTPSQAIELWARMFAAAVTADPRPGVRVYYVSGSGDPPGMLLMEAMTPTAPSFSVYATVEGEKFEPSLLTTVTSTQDIRPNGLSISRTGLFYAFPPDSAHHLRLGAADKKILRILPNRDSLWVFKEDGIWRVYEAGDRWGYQQISSDVVLAAPESLAVLDNQVVGLTNKGVVAVDESGVEEIDLAVKNITTAILSLEPPSVMPPTTSRNVFGLADPVRGRYYLWYPTSYSDTYATRALVYNSTTDTWTERSDAATGGYIGAGGLLYLGAPTTATVTEQRRTGTAEDFRAPDGGPIDFEIEFLPLRNGNPSGSSQFTELRLILEEPTTGEYEFTFTNDFGESESVVAEGEGLPVVRVWVPDGMQRTSRLGVKVKREVLDEYLVVLGLRDAADDYDGPPSKS